VKPYGRRVVDFVGGRRNTLIFNKKRNRICEMDLGVFCSNGWKHYAQTIPRRKHNAAKKSTFTVEGYNSRIRHYLARFKRKDQVLFKTLAHDGNIPEITVPEMGQLAENAICLTTPKYHYANIDIYFCFCVSPIPMLSLSCQELNTEDLLGWKLVFDIDFRCTEFIGIDKKNKTA